MNNLMQVTQEFFNALINDKSKPTKDDAVDIAIDLKNCIDRHTKTIENP
jgi:hypothetical protein